MTPNVMENLTTFVPQSSQNTSKIDLEGVLEAAREPPLCRGDSKTSFFMFLGYFRTQLGNQFWVILGIIF